LRKRMVDFRVRVFGSAAPLAEMRRCNKGENRNERANAATKNRLT